LGKKKENPNKGRGVMGGGSRNRKKKIFQKISGEARGGKKKRSNASSEKRS